ncbi:MAG: transposase [Verrucomicrobia bacterium]|nr:transposase [Verrucomicrobiota bacterium]
MRQRRLKAPANSYSETAFYHCISRVVNRDFVLGDEEREEFVRLMRVYERLCGVRVVTYCVMSNHFHVLVGVPKKPEVMPSNHELIATVRASLGDLAATNLEYDLEQAAKIKSAQWEEEIRERYLRRMWDVSSFMKTLKQRFAQWFNKRHKRKGTFWEDRFRSVLVQSAGETVAAMAAYIDLNPIRANMMEDPQEYRWSGYGAAMGGDAQAVEGLREIDKIRHIEMTHAMAAQKPTQTTSEKAISPVLPPRTPKAVLEGYRALLYGRGEERGVGEDGSALKKGFTREESQQVVAQGGRLPRSVYLRCRVRYFTDGAVIGSKDFVNEVFTKLKDRFGEKRKTGARLMKGLERDKRLYAMRDLKRDTVS